MDKITLQIQLSSSAEQLYADWLDSSAHTAMTGGEATVEAKIGGKHSAWDGYIWGEISELDPGKKIIQSWRTSEFPADAPDSKLELVFEDIESGKAQITLIHSNLQPGDGLKYDKGWEDHYWIPMREYYG